MREISKVVFATNRDTLTEEQNKMLDKVHWICVRNIDRFPGSNTWFAEPYSPVARFTVEGYRTLQKLHGVINEDQYNYYLGILKDVRFGKSSSPLYKNDGIGVKEDLKEEYPDIKFRKLTITKEYGDIVVYRIVA